MHTLWTGLKGAVMFGTVAILITIFTAPTIFGLVIVTSSAMAAIWFWSFFGGIVNIIIDWFSNRYFNDDVTDEELMNGQDNP